ncbi:MAG: hypothetical protein JXR61_05935 [Prolixibacteraceae bacterium]|nr:hypothetical protein [Prolixibacteraceae bacterium]
MQEKNKNVLSVLVLWVFLFPTIVVLEHHHEIFSCDAQGEQHLHQYHQKCDICNFEFQVFEKTPENICFRIEQVVVDFYDKHNSHHCFNPAKYSFLLRAPPYRQA